MKLRLLFEKRMQFIEEGSVPSHITDTKYRELIPYTVHRRVIWSSFCGGQFSVIMEVRLAGSPTFLAPGTGFVEDRFSKEGMVSG